MQTTIDLADWKIAMSYKFHLRELYIDCQATQNAQYPMHIFGSILVIVSRLF
jgi:hypothetical protein